MSHSDLGDTPAVKDVRLAPSRRAARKAGFFQCLIVSKTFPRQKMLASAAVDNQWEPLVCGDVRSAATCLQTEFLQLAIVDLESTSGESFRGLVQKLSEVGRLLVIVCGNKGDANEEVWARQLGVWLYLPGISATKDLSLLCGEARQIAAKLQGPPEPAPTTNGHAAPIATARKDS